MKVDGVSPFSKRLVMLVFLAANCGSFRVVLLSSVGGIKTIGVRSGGATTLHWTEAWGAACSLGNGTDVITAQLEKMWLGGNHSKYEV